MNAAKVNDPATANNSALSIRILKIGTCPTLSTRGTLTYNICCREDGEVMFRVWANTGGAFFSKEWVSMDAIEVASSKIPFDKAVTSYSLLSSLFKGRSINTFAFLMAVLLEEKLVERAPENDKCFLRCDPNEFMDHIQKLIDSDISLEVDEKPSKPAPAKPAAPIKKVSKKKA